MCGGKELQTFNNEIAMNYLLKRYSERISSELLKLFAFPEPCQYEDYLFSRNNFITQSREKTLKFGFQLYDEDKDGIISEYDLYSPFVTWKKKLYEEAYINDLAKMMTQVNNKKNMAESKERVGLSFDEFSLIFVHEYPAIIKDIATNVLMYQYIEKDVPRNIKVQEKDKYNKLIEGAYRIQGEDINTSKIIAVFKILAVNSNKSSMHITDESLRNGFVYIIIKYRRKYSAIKVNY